MKYKHCKHCHDKLKHLSLFVLSIGDILGKEALFKLESLSGLMAEKMDEPISHVRGCMNVRVAIEITRPY